MKRLFAGLLFLVVASVGWTAPSTTAVTVAWQELTGSYSPRLTNRITTITPLSTPRADGTRIALSDPVRYTNDANGQFVTMLTPGSYKLEVQGPTAKVTPVMITVPESPDPSYDASTLITSSTNLTGADVAYSASAADARFVRASTTTHQFTGQFSNVLSSNLVAGPGITFDIVTGNKVRITGSGTNDMVGTNLVLQAVDDTATSGTMTYRIFPNAGNSKTNNTFWADGIAVSNIFFYNPSSGVMRGQISTLGPGQFVLGDEDGVGSSCNTELYFAYSYSVDVAGVSWAPMLQFDQLEDKSLKLVDNLLTNYWGLHVGNLTVMSNLAATNGATIYGTLVTTQITFGGETFIDWPTNTATSDGQAGWLTNAIATNTSENLVALSIRPNTNGGDALKIYDKAGTALWTINSNANASISGTIDFGNAVTFQAAPAFNSADPVLMAGGLQVLAGITNTTLGDIVNQAGNIVVAAPFVFQGDGTGLLGLQVSNANLTTWAEADTNRLSIYQLGSTNLTNFAIGWTGAVDVVSTAPTNQQVLTYSNGTWYPRTPVAASGGTPGGTASGQVQFNSGGAFGGDEDFNFWPDSNALILSSSAALYLKDLDDGAVLTISGDRRLVAAHPLITSNHLSLLYGHTALQPGSDNLTNWATWSTNALGAILNAKQYGTAYLTNWGNLNPAFYARISSGTNLAVSNLVAGDVALRVFAGTNWPTTNQFEVWGSNSLLSFAVRSDGAVLGPVQYGSAVLTNFTAGRINDTLMSNSVINNSWLTNVALINGTNMGDFVVEGTGGGEIIVYDVSHDNYSSVSMPDDPTTNRTIYLPAANGTLLLKEAFVSDVAVVSPANAQVLTYNGSQWVASNAVAASGSATNVFDIDFSWTSSTGGTTTLIWSNAVATNTTVRVKADVLVGGPTNSADYEIRAVVRRDTGGDVALATNLATVNYEGNADMDAFFTNSATHVLLYATSAVLETNTFSVLGFIDSVTNPGATPAPPGEALLFDLLGTYTNNIAYAYSTTRKLRADYSGDAMTVRRTSDNAITNIGFVGNDVDTNGIATWCGTSPGAITNLFDQTWLDSTNTRLTHATSTRQPVIYDGTNINTLHNGSGFAMDANGNQSLRVINTVGMSNAVTIFAVIEQRDAEAVAGNEAAEYFVRLQSATDCAIGKQNPYTNAADMVIASSTSAGIFDDTFPVNTNVIVVAYFTNATTAYLRVYGPDNSTNDATGVAPGAFNNTTGFCLLGQGATSQNIKGRMTECIVFNNVILADETRELVVSNLNAKYNIW